MREINGERLKERRKELGLSQDALAKKLKISKVAICWYELGERTPTLNNFIKLADELDLSLDELLGREINVVAQNEENYKTKMAKKDIEIISEIKKKKDLYSKLYENPKRTVELIERKIK